jgi:transcriptional regulator with XRE-family HTH domain
MHYAFCMNLRSWRKSQNLSADELARRIGIAGSTLMGYENGTRRPKAKTAQKIETITKGAVSAASLLGLTSRTVRGVREEAEPFVEAEQLTIEVPVSAGQSRLLQEQGVDIEAVARTGAKKAIREAEARAWAEANREAIDAYNAWIKKHGTLAEQLGLI